MFYNKRILTGSSIDPASRCLVHHPDALTGMAAVLLLRGCGKEDRACKGNDAEEKQHGRVIGNSVRKLPGMNEPDVFADRGQGDEAGCGES